MLSFFPYKFSPQLPTSKNNFLPTRGLRFSRGESIENRFVNESSIRLSRHPSNDSWASCQQETRQSTSKPETPPLQTKQTLSNNAFDPRHTILSGKLRAQAINMRNRGELRKTGEKTRRFESRKRERKREKKEKKSEKRKRKKLLTSQIHLDSKRGLTPPSRPITSILSSIVFSKLPFELIPSILLIVAFLTWFTDVPRRILKERFPIFFPKYFRNFLFPSDFKNNTIFSKLLL